MRESAFFLEAQARVSQLREDVATSSKLYRPQSVARKMKFLINSHIYEKIKYLQRAKALRIIIAFTFLQTASLLVL